MTADRKQNNGYDHDLDEPIDPVEDEEFDDYIPGEDPLGGVKPLDFND